MLLNYMDEWSTRFGIGVDFHSGGLDRERLPTEIETTIYRIVQEALTNVVKHAEASHLSLILVRGEDHLLAIIEDNGKGFDVDKVIGSISGPHHLGLLGMKERVALAGGTFELESSVGKGATLFIRIPLLSELKENSL
jgi:signal transduction histidine kinase